MSDTSVYAASSDPRPERRRDARHSVTTPVYLDVGTDNGGILLNVSEHGIGFVAIAPLDGRGKVKLRIQFPSGRPEIETAAQIVWFDESNRQTGVRLVAMSSEVQAQVQDWVGSEVALQAPEPPTLEQPIAGAPQSTQETAAAIPVPRDEAASVPGASLAPDIGAASAPVAEHEMGASVAEPQAHADLAAFEQPPTVLPESGQLAVEEHSTYSESAIQEPERRPKAPLETDEPHPSLGAVSAHADHGAILDWPIPSSRVAQPAPPAPVPQLFESVQPPTPARDLKPEPVAIGWDDTPVSPARTETGQVKKWIWATTALAFFSFLCLCFGIGMLVHSHRRQSAGAVVATAPARGETAKIESAPPKPERQARASSSKTRIESYKRKRPENDNVASSHAAASHQGSPLNQVPKPVQQAAVAPASTPPSESTPTAPTLPSSPTDSTLRASEPRIVAGRPLKFTDRFNPCHLTYRLEPAYPAEARERGIEGTVRIRQVIGPDGAVRSVKLLSGPVELAPAALDAAKYWRYLPAMLNGQPIETDQDIAIEFHSPR